jgi:hypothetical protein
VKKSLKYLLLIVLTLATVSLTSCYSALNGALKISEKPRVFMTAQPGQGKLNIHTAGSPKCEEFTGKNEVGCLVAEYGEFALLSFGLNGSPDWYFAQITICKGDSKTEQDCSLDVWERREFEAYDGTPDGTRYSPDNNGVIQLPTGSDAMDVVFVLDHNLVQQDFFYSIKACYANPPNRPSRPCVDTDPPIINRGRY